MKFYKLNCEVPGGLGKETIYDKNSLPWEIRHPHILMEGWLGGELLTISSCLFVTDALMKRMLFNYAGILSYATFQIETSDNFKILQPDTKLPRFKWMKVDNKAFSDDIALTYYKNRYNQLIISERLWQVLSEFNLGHYSIEPAEKIIGDR